LQKSFSAIGGKHPAESARRPFLQTERFVDAKHNHRLGESGKEFVKI